jgi:hypothetical protein
MRWLLIHPGPNFSVADVHTGWMEALRGLGQHVVEYNLDRRLSFYDQALLADDLTDADGRQAVHKALTREQAIELAANGILSACYQTWPDVVMAVSAFFTPSWMLEVIRARNHKIVMLFTESPYQDGMQLEMAKFADISLVNDPVNLTAYGEHGPAAYMPHAYRPAVHYPASSPAREYDLAFVGTGFPSRVRFFEQMNLQGLRTRFEGVWMDLPPESPLRNWADFSQDGCVGNAETAAIYRSSRTGINFYRREAEDAHTGEGWACGPREIEMAACGLWFARDPRPESDNLFPMLPAFSSPQEASEHVRWAVTHEAAREKAAVAARKAIAGRTFDSHAKTLLAMLDT